MLYQIVITHPARKQLHKLPAMICERITLAIDGLAVEPRPHGVESVKGLPGTYRIRVGDYRIIYSIQDEKLLILVVRIGHRRDVYRQLG